MVMTQYGVKQKIKFKKQYSQIENWNRNVRTAEDVKSFNDTQG